MMELPPWLRVAQPLLFASAVLTESAWVQVGGNQGLIRPVTWAHMDISARLRASKSE